MLKTFTVLLFTFVSGMAGAMTQTDSPWVLISSVQEKANNSAEFIILQDKYPQVFGNYDSTHVTSANIEFSVWEFKGQTVCPVNDPRLRRETVSYGLCEQYGQAAQCFQTATLRPDSDPCLR